MGTIEKKKERGAGMAFFAITFARSTKYPLFTLLALPRAESRVGF
jgi:hypothetical protein